jgi:4-amino-4-deoxy-L-arabinose transferase-like glycosyltransferase
MAKVEIMRKKISLIFNSLRLWIKQNPVEFWILTTILVVGSVSRLYQINQYMTFLGDEGRDVIIVRRLLTEGHPPLIGPGTSIGNMYLGPLYYYFMAPGLFLTNFSPVGPAVQIALLGIITIWMVWYVGREWFGKNVALIASCLYAISPIVIIYSRSSWNPNIMPFFAILSVYSIWRVFKHYEFKWMLVLGVAFALGFGKIRYLSQRLYAIHCTQLLFLHYSCPHSLFLICVTAG